jgi:hypothetical protein
MTKDKDKTTNATFDNWDPDVDWQTSPWNYKGYFGIKKRELQVLMDELAVNPKQGVPKQVEASVTAAGEKASVVTISQDGPHEGPGT